MENIKISLDIVNGTYSSNIDLSIIDTSIDRVDDTVLEMRVFELFSEINITFNTIATKYDWIDNGKCGNGKYGYDMLFESKKKIHHATVKAISNKLIDIAEHFNVPVEIDFKKV